jgi:hypothetical protein
LDETAHDALDHTGLTGVPAAEAFTEAAHDLHDHTGLTGVATDFTDLGDAPSAYGAGDAGKVVVVNSTEDGLEFDDAPAATNGVPAGGTENQLCAKNSGTDYDCKWMDAPAASNGLPAGGTAGQILTKDSATDYDASWQAPSFSGARYTTNAGQTITSGAALAVVDFEDMDYDTDSAVTTGANWNYAVPSAGYYRVSVMIQFAISSAWETGERGLLKLFISGAEGPGLDRRDNHPTNTLMLLSGSVTIHCPNGTETLDIRLAQNSGSNINLDGSAYNNWVCIEKIG